MLITWEDKLHDKMTSAYSKSCGYKKFSVHTNTKKYRFQIVPLWRTFSKRSVFVDLFMRISVDGSRIRNNKVAFSNLSGIVWLRPSATEPCICCKQVAENPRGEHLKMMYECMYECSVDGALDSLYGRRFVHRNCFVNTTMINILPN